MRKIFERMLDSDVRMAFINKKSLHISETNAEFVRMKEYILSDECTNDINRLKNGDYFLDIPIKHYIKKRNSTKVRTVYVFPEKQKSLLKLMSYALNAYSRVFSKCLYSFRPKKNHAKFFERARAIDRYRTHYVVKTDAHAYTDSMDPEILDKHVKEILFEQDPEVYNFIHWFLNRWEYYYNGELHHEKFTLSCGVPLSSLFCNAYLMHVDRIFDKKYPLYMRFSDDIAVFCKTEQEAIEAKEILEREFAKLHLEPNREKTYIFKPGEAFTILGFETGVNEIDIAPGSVQKIISRINRVEKKLLKSAHHKKYTKEQIYHYGDKFQRRLLYGTPNHPTNMSWSVWTFATITTDKSLKVIDNRIQNFLRSIYTGKKCKARYRMSYEEIKELGYTTLVNKYHNREKLYEMRKGNKN